MRGGQEVEEGRRMGRKCEKRRQELANREGKRGEGARGFLQDSGQMSFPRPVSFGGLFSLFLAVSN